MLSKRNNKNICIIFVLLCIGFLFKIRNTVNTPYLTGGSGGIWNIVTIIIYALWIKNLIDTKKVVLNSTAVFAFLYSYFAFFNALINMGNFSVSYIYNVFTIFYFFIIFSLFKNLSSKAEIFDKTYNVYIISGLAISIFVMYHILKHYNMPDNAMYVVTDVYYALNMMPLVLLSKNKWLKGSGVVVTLTLLILSGKRTGLVALLFGFMCYFLIMAYCDKDKKIIKAKKNQHYIFKLVLMSFFVIITFNFLSAKFELNLLERLIMAVEEGEGGREIIWSAIINAMNEAPISKWIFGHGIKAVTILMGSKNALAHNDYLEILYDFGFFPLVMYICFQISILFKTINLIIKRNPLSANLAFCLVIYLFMSFFSNYVIDATYITYNMISIGIIYGTIERGTLDVSSSNK